MVLLQLQLVYLLPLQLVYLLPLLAFHPLLLEHLQLVFLLPLLVLLLVTIKKNELKTKNFIKWITNIWKCTYFIFSKNNFSVIINTRIWNIRSFWTFLIPCWLITSIEQIIDILFFFNYVIQWIFSFSCTILIILILCIWIISSLKESFHFSLLRFVIISIWIIVCVIITCIIILLFFIVVLIT